MSDTVLESVILCDDDPHVARIATLSLERVGGLKVKVASSGAEAIELAKTHPVDLILLDVMMPVLDGPGTLLELRKMPETQDVPVIFLTAKAQENERERLLRLGALSVIHKPFDPMGLPGELRVIYQAYRAAKK